MEASEQDYSYDIQLDDEKHLENKTYRIRCRLCRNQLLVSDKVKFSHSGKTEACGNCIFLDEDFLPDWIKDEIENSLWTKGRLKCPRADCTARVGGFDFIQGLLCGCGEFTIPAIWIQDGKVDVRAINSNDFTSAAKPSLMTSHQSWLEESSSITGRVITSDDVLSKTKPSLNATASLMVSSDESHSRQMPVLMEYSRHQFPSQDIGKTRKNGPNTPGQPACIDKMYAVTDGQLETIILTEDISSSRQGSFCHDRGEIGDTGFPQSIHCEHLNIGTGTTEVRTGQLATNTHPMTSTVKHRKSKVNRRDIAFLEQNTDRTHRITKPVKTKVDEIGTTSSNSDPVSNRFNPLSVEEPPIAKPSDHTNPDEVMQEHLICAVCLDYFYKPYQCPCSHVFCESCLRQLYHNRVGKLKCPICRSTVRYVEPANEVREEIRQLRDPALKQRELFEKTAKYRAWSLPPIGPLPFLRRRQTLVPKRDQNLVILAAILLLVVCYAILYKLP